MAHPAVQQANKRNFYKNGCLLNVKFKFRLYIPHWHVHGFGEAQAELKPVRLEVRACKMRNISHLDTRNVRETAFGRRPLS
jgi:hypothetical protein